MRMLTVPAIAFCVLTAGGTSGSEVDLRTARITVVDPTNRTQTLAVSPDWTYRYTPPFDCAKIRYHAYKKPKDKTAAKIKSIQRWCWSRIFKG